MSNKDIHSVEKKVTTSDKDGPAITQIVQCIQTIIEEATSNEFKQKCLDIMNVDDFGEFNKKTTRKLRKLLKRRHGSFSVCRRKSQETIKENMNVATKAAESQAQKVPYSPIRKRYRKEPLLPVSQNLITDENNCITKNFEEIEKIDSCSQASAKILSMSPRCVDISKLCDLINGVDQNIDEWLSTEEPFSTEKCGIQGTTMYFDENKAVDKENADDVDKYEFNSDDILNSAAKLLDSDVTSEINTVNEKSVKMSKMISPRKDYNSRESPELSSEVDWLEEFKHDKFWGELTSSTNKDENQNNDVFDLDAKELFRIDNFQITEIKE